MNSSSHSVSPIDQDSIIDHYLPFIAKLDERGFNWIGGGSFRSVYARKDIVIKVPKYMDGILDNLVEAAAWHKYKSRPTNMGIHLAPCRILPNGSLMMVRVHSAYSRNIQSDWARLVDSHQVGYHRAGTIKEKLVAYDFALDIVERLSWEKRMGIGDEDSFFQRLWIKFGDREHLRKDFPLAPI